MSKLIVNGEPQPCPVCSTDLEPYETRSGETFYRHPLTGCVLDDFRLGPDRQGAWNTDVEPASQPLPSEALAIIETVLGSTMPLGGPVTNEHITDAASVIYNALQQAANANPLPSEATLPCDVRLTPATTILKGCKLSTLIEALKQRGMQS